MFTKAPRGWHWSDRERGVLIRDHDGARASLGTRADEPQDTGLLGEWSCLERCTVLMRPAGVAADGKQKPMEAVPVPAAAAFALLIAHSLVHREDLRR